MKGARRNGKRRLELRAIDLEAELELARRREGGKARCAKDAWQEAGDSVASTRKRMIGIQSERLPDRARIPCVFLLVFQGESGGTEPVRKVREPAAAGSRHLNSCRRNTLVTLTQEKQIRAPGELAQRYARAFCAYLQATHEGAHERNHVLKRVRALQEALFSNPDLRTFLDNPRLASQPPHKVAATLAEGLGLGDDLRRLIGVVAREGRLDILGEILEAILLLDAQERGEVAVEVCTARRLTDDQRQSIRHSLKEAGHHHISMTERVDPALLGGMTVRVGPVLFDTSIAGRLTRLQHAMKGAA